MVQDAGLVGRGSSSLNRLTSLVWGVSSFGRAPLLQSGGEGFESPTFHAVQSQARLRDLTVVFVVTIHNATSCVSHLAPLAQVVADLTRL